MRSELLEWRILPLWERKIVCAVSGGLDSMCLLHMLDAWRREREGQVIAAHFNHQLRGEAAERDEDFVREICEKWGVPYVAGRGDVRAFAKREGLSIEEAARAMRYGFLRQTAKMEGCGFICTAHHADDNAETILLNLVRGTGLKGLTGMEWRRDMILRPLLNVTRTELEAYAAQWNIPHIEDETNADPDAASRNFLRLQVMPLLKELNPEVVKHISRTAGQLETADRFLEEEARRRTAHVKVRDGRVVLSAEDLFNAPEAVRPKMLLRLFDLLGAGRRDIGAVHLNAIFDMVSHTGERKESSLNLPHGVTAWYCRHRLILETRRQLLTKVQLLPGQPLRWGDYTLALLDHREGEGLPLWDRTSSESWAVTVAPCVPGERLTLPGARGSRSVKRLCLDRRISLEERGRLPAVYTNGQLAAVWRLGVDIAFAPEDGKSLRFIKITKHIEEDGHDEKRNGE